MRVLSFTLPPFPAIKILVGPSAPPIMDTLLATLSIPTSPCGNVRPPHMAIYHMRRLLLCILYLSSAILPVNLFTFFFAPQMATP